MRIGTLVEGHGEVQALPVLLRRVGDFVKKGLVLDVPVPHRVPRDQLTREDSLRRPLDLMASKAGRDAPILILLDADDDCPADLGPRIATIARKIRPDRRIGVVLAHREFECWFLAGLSSLRGVRRLPRDIVGPPDPEAVRDAKGWLSARMPQPYAPRVDQAALASCLDLEAALPGSPSLRKLVREVARLADLPTPKPAER